MGVHHRRRSVTAGWSRSAEVDEVMLGIICNCRGPCRKKRLSRISKTESCWCAQRAESRCHPTRATKHPSRAMMEVLNSVLDLAEEQGEVRAMVLRGRGGHSRRGGRARHDGGAGGGAGGRPLIANRSRHPHPESRAPALGRDRRPRGSRDGRRLRSRLRCRPRAGLGGRRHEASGQAWGSCPQSLPLSCSGWALRRLAGWRSRVSRFGGQRPWTSDSQTSVSPRLSWTSDSADCSLRSDAVLLSERADQGSPLRRDHGGP